MRVELRETIEFVPANDRAKTNHYGIFGCFWAITAPDYASLCCVYFQRFLISSIIGRQVSVGLFTTGLNGLLFNAT